jgi:hypothetical protein
MLLYIGINCFLYSNFQIIIPQVTLLILIVYFQLPIVILSFAMVDIA